jgi:hypothetical protein
MIRQARFLSSFPRIDRIDDSTYGDAVLVLDHLSRGQQRFNDLPADTYVLRLDNGLFIPGTVLEKLAPAQHSAVPPAPMPADYVGRRPGAHLILTSEDRLFSESLMRNHLLDPRIIHAGHDSFALPEIGTPDIIDDEVVFIDLICAHFGHAIVDTPARLWYLLAPELAALRHKRIVAFGSHGVGSWLGGRDRWPGYLKHFLNAIGINPARIEVLTQPTRIARAYIPRRLSPLFAAFGYGPRYIAAAQTIGAGLTSFDSMGATPPRVYLSRARLLNDPRHLPNDGEARIEWIFAALGFAIIHPETLPLPDQIAALRGASHVAGCVGSHLHLMAMGARPGVHLFRIAPSFFDTPVDAHILRELGGHYRPFLVEATLPPGTQRHMSGWPMPPDVLTALHHAASDWLSETG